MFALFFYFVFAFIGCCCWFLFVFGRNEQVAEQVLGAHTLTKSVGNKQLAKTKEKELKQLRTCTRTTTNICNNINKENLCLWALNNNNNN